MNTRIVRLCCLLLGCLLLADPTFFSNSAAAQEKTKQPTLAGSVAELTKAVSKLSEQMVTTDDLNNLVTKGELQSKVKALSAAIQDQSIQIQAMRTEFVELLAAVDAQVEEQGKILAAISRRDKDGNYTLPLESIMDNSPSFSKEMKDVVNKSIRTHGTLLIENKMNLAQSLRVNGQDYRIPAKSKLNVPVPVGTVTTELVGYEAPKHLTVSPPTYLQRVVISPGKRAQVYVSPPMIIDDPLFLVPPIGNGFSIYRY
ncbi:MAG TPA: hypothetical protein EYN70_05030 [Planctomycetaceae bacterium]|nr:hypothetical protein [Planctomycetaceae bacterium]